MFPLYGLERKDEEREKSKKTRRPNDEELTLMVHKAYLESTKKDKFKTIHSIANLITKNELAK